MKKAIAVFASVFLFALVVAQGIATAGEVGQPFRQTMR